METAAGADELGHVDNRISTYTSQRAKHEPQLDAVVPPSEEGHWIEAMTPEQFINDLIQKGVLTHADVDARYGPIGSLARLLSWLCGAQGDGLHPSYGSCRGESSV